MEVLAQSRGSDVHRLQLLRSEGVDEHFSDDTEVGCGALAKKTGSLSCELDGGTPGIAGYAVSLDETALFHPAKVVREPAALPSDDVRQFRRSQSPLGRLAQRKQDAIVTGCDA